MEKSASVMGECQDGRVGVELDVGRSMVRYHYRVVHRENNITPFSIHFRSKKVKIKL